MGENQTKILQMLAEGKISVDEATRLLSLVGEESRTESAGSPPLPKRNARFLYVKVEPKEGYEKRSAHWEEGHHQPERVNVRIPVALVRAGMKLTALMPPEAAENVNKALKDKGMAFDIRNLKDEYIEQLIDALQDSHIDVDSDEATIRVYAE
jgi:SHOCT-like domain